MAGYSTMIDSMEVYAQLKAEDETEAEHSIKVKITAGEIQIQHKGRDVSSFPECGDAVITLTHKDLDSVVVLVKQCRDAWENLNEKPPRLFERPRDIA